MSKNTLTYLITALIIGLAKGAASRNGNLSYQQKRDFNKTANESFQKATDTFRKNYDKENGL